MGEGTKVIQTRMNKAGKVIGRISGTVISKGPVQQLNGEIHVWVRWDDGSKDWEDVEFIEEA